MVLNRAFTRGSLAGVLLFSASLPLESRYAERHMVLRDCWICLFGLGVVAGAPLAAIAVGDAPTALIEKPQPELVGESFHSPDEKFSIHVSCWDPAAAGEVATIELRSIPDKRVISTLRVAGGRHFSALWKPDNSLVAITYEEGVSAFNNKLLLFQVTASGFSEVKVKDDLAVENFVPKGDPAKGLRFGIQRIGPSSWLPNGDLVCKIAANARIADQRPQNGNMLTSGFVSEDYEVVIRIVGASEAKVVESKRTFFETNE